MGYVFQRSLGGWAMRAIVRSGMMWENVNEQFSEND